MASFGTIRCQKYLVNLLYPRQDSLMLDYRYSRLCDNTTPDFPGERGVSVADARGTPGGHDLRIRRGTGSWR